MMFSIIIAKAVSFLLRLFKRGATSLPGRVAVYLKFDILTRLSRGVKTVIITGTNGKTTTAALVAFALEKSGLSYFINKSGANMLGGVTSAFIENSSIFGHCKKEYAIIECDENSLPLISRYIDASAVAVTNIFRDQLDRYGEVEHTLAVIKSGIKNLPSAILVLNADDPISYSLSRLTNESVTFGVDADIKTSSPPDIRHCLFCGAELKYKNRTISHLGNFYCPKCAYRRSPPDCEIGEIRGDSFTLKNELCTTSLKGLYNLYNLACAAAVLDVLGVGKIKDLCAFSGAFGRMESFSVNGRTVLLLLVKNPAGFSGCIRYVASIKGDIDIGFALNDNEADSTDVSWIWDVDFTPLQGKDARVYTLGIRSLDMALRLKYDGIAPEEILEGEPYARLIEIINETNRDFVVFSSYTAMMNMRRHFISAFGGKEFWK